MFIFLLIEVQYICMSIEDKIKNYAKELFGDSFAFREHQLDAVVRIVNNTAANIKQTVLEAPTGSGKSVIAMLVAYVLYKEYGKRSYILVSDLSLFAQYEEDMKKLHADCFGWIKGKENYICHVNGCNVSQSSCSLQNVSVAHNSGKSSNLFSCRNYCQYAKEYSKAINSPITLMTYQLYFIQRNYVEDCIFNGKNPNFPARDLVICDECHKICEICQGHFAPKISISRPKWMDVLDRRCAIDPLESSRVEIVSGILDSKDENELFSYASRYMDYISRYVSINDAMRESLAKKKKLTKAEKNALAAGNAARQEHCKFDDMLDFVSELNAAKFLVKTATKEDITLNFIFDNVMLMKYLHMKSKCELLMSATIGDFNEFAKISGLDKDTFKAISIPSTFDFSNSPVCISNANKMSYAEKDTSIVQIVKQIVDICRESQTSKGIIQTGNYQNSSKLKEMLPYDVLHRCIFYNGSVDKAKALDAFTMDPKDNKILVGPTLIEGLNFPDDMCRFQICMKVPYAFLGNEYVKKKMEYVEGWYEYDALNKICQGIGRGIRHKNDWCKTFILDGCIMNLMNGLKRFNVLNGRFRRI